MSRLDRALAVAGSGLVRARSMSSRARTVARSRLDRAREALRRALLPEGTRLTLTWTLAAAVGLGVMLPVSASVREAGGAATRLPLLLILLIVMLSVSSLAFAGVTLWVMQDLPRRRLVAAARLPRARRAVRAYRWYLGRSSALSEVVQMLVMAVLAAMLLIVAPPGCPPPRCSRSPRAPWSRRGSGRW